MASVKGAFKVQNELYTSHVTREPNSLYAKTKAQRKADQRFVFVRKYVQPLYLKYLAICVIRLYLRLSRYDWTWF